MLGLAALAAFAVVFVPTGSAKPPSPVGTYQACLIAGDGNASCTTATDNYSVLTGSNPELQVTIANNSASNQTLDYANVNVPAGIGLSIDTAHSPQPVSYTTYASSSTSSQLQLRNLALAPGTSKTVAFFVNSTSSSCTDGTWSTQARSGSTPSAFVFSTPPTAASGLTSLVSVNCSLSFQTGPTAALPNQTITGSAYAPSGSSVTVATPPLPVALNGGAVNLSISAGAFDPAVPAWQFVGTGPVALSGGSAAFGSLKATGTGGPFILKASAAGFSDATSSPPFAITKNGEACDPLVGCQTLTGTDPNGKTLTQITTGAGFAFVGTSPSEVPFNPAPAGCQPWSPTPGVSGFAEFDGRTPGGAMTITYYIPQNAIKARYGKNVGQQFVPICIGVKTIDPDSHLPVDCPLPGAAGGWTGDGLDANGAFTGQPAAAICGANGYWWAIISSFQDKLDQSVNPVVTSWSSPTIQGTTYRAFVISVPSNLDMQGHG